MVVDNLAGLGEEEGKLMVGERENSENIEAVGWREKGASVGGERGVSFPRGGSFTRGVSFPRGFFFSSHLLS